MLFEAGPVQFRIRKYFSEIILHSNAVNLV